MSVKLIFCSASLFIILSLQRSYQASRSGDDSKVFVHLVPHTHDDVGWLKTVDEYYYGSKQLIQRAAVQYILDTVVEELQQNENRTFIYVEMAFFTRWWHEQDEKTRSIVKALVAKKQLEFTNAGWCMNDEATTSYTDIIDQMTLGLQFVEETFGADARPRVAWHIDPFGHSSTMASLLAQMGFQGFFFARIDHADYKQRVKSSALEMVWTPSPLVSGEGADIFTGVLYNGYFPPFGFCFDINCDDPPIQDDPDLMDYNVDSVVERFVKVVLDQRVHYKTNHVMLTMGSDFQFQNAHQVFKNLDKLIKYTNEKIPNMEVFYSSPTRYLDAVYNSNVTWNVKTDDFFPYADNSMSYWTGYYTSRPALKQYVRAMSGMLQICKQMEAFARVHSIKRKTSSSTDALKRAMGVSQHHDAVSGTEMQHVADDYAKRLHIGSVECQSLIQDVLSSVMMSTNTLEPPMMVYCEYLNISLCPLVEEQSAFNVVVYNPLLTESPLVLWLPLSEETANSHLTVVDDTGTTMTSQIQTVSLAIQNARRNRGSARYELALRDNLPPLGFKMYFVRAQEKQPPNYSASSSSFKKSSFAQEASLKSDYGEDFTIGTGPMEVTIDGVTGRVKAMRNTVSNVSAKVDQAFYWYPSSCGGLFQNSGAYIFSSPTKIYCNDDPYRERGESIGWQWPATDSAVPCEWNGKVHVNILVKGDLYTEYRQQFNDTIYQTVRVYNDLPYVEFDYVVGPLYVKDGVGKEVVSRFTTDLETDSTWYTDSNGREMQKRVYNFRPTWQLTDKEVVAQNYYPVTSKIFIKDEAKDVQFTVFTDRSQGGASLKDGEVELMVHRRLTCDDGRGVREVLSEDGQFGSGLIIRGRHYVLLDTIKRSNTLHWSLGRSFAWKPHPIIMFNRTESGAYVPPITNFSFLNKDNLPANLHLLTFEAQSGNSYLLRLENIFDAGNPLNVSLLDIFKVPVQSVVELSLGGNAKLPMESKKWATTGKAENDSKAKTQHSHPVSGPYFFVVLNPMEIRTFQVFFS